jgi:bifunctional UDP-N-acetylglucosamine pyrophosphorylase/glucosamine-1-phosphate N-acetyltransferase
MVAENIAVVVLAAGLGTRMKSSLPKVMHPLAGRPMINHLLDTVAALAPQRVVVVIGPGMEAVAQAVAPHPAVLQAEQLGTGHAVRQAKEALAGFTGTVLVLYGDTPLIGRPTLEAMLERRGGRLNPAVVVLGFRPADPAEYGRLVVGPDGLSAIVEYGDATPDERALDLCNAGVMAIDGGRLFALVDGLSNANAKGEYYLTDIVGLARAEGAACAFVEGEPEELLGINTRRDLAAAEAVVQGRLRRAAMDNGVTLEDPGTVHLSWDTRLGQDVHIGPFVYFGPGVTIGNGVEIRSFCHIVGATIAPGADVGPFARLRPGALIGRQVHVGNFVEVKNATLEEGVKVGHLTYLGDARIGAGANIGAGTITCNYDGFNKSFTDIGKGAFIGSNTSLVAPVVVGDGSIVGAGSVITRNVAEGSLAVARGTQLELPGWVERFRERKRAEKEARKKE